MRESSLSGSLFLEIAGPILDAHSTQSEIPDRFKPPATLIRREPFAVRLNVEARGSPQCRVESLSEAPRQYPADRLAAAMSRWHSVQR